MAAKKALSLAELSNKINELESTIGQKANYIFDLFSDKSTLPVDITTEEDSPGLWPSTGVCVYSVLSSMNVTEMFCTEGMIVHFASARFCFQFMYVIKDVIDSTKEGKIYVRTGSQDSNEWNFWEVLNTSKNSFQSLAYKGYMRRKAKEVVIDVDPKVNYTEIALSIASYYSSAAKQELLGGADFEGVVNNLAGMSVDFSGNLLDIDEGDIIIYGNSYMAIYDGAGGCFGSSIEPGEVVHFDNCLDVHWDISPTKVIKL